MTNKRRGEVVFSGIGGGGVLLAGEFVAEAAYEEYEHVVWFPNYSAAVRGGPSECFVIYSDEEIASPVLSQVQTVVVLDPAQLKACEVRVRSGGTIILESTGLQGKVNRRDVTVIEVPATAMARAIGNPRGANFILLGVYMGVSKLIPPELIEKNLASRFGDKAKPNIDAFREGLKVAKGRKQPSAS